MRLKDLSVTTAEIYNLPLDLLTTDPEFNVRNSTPALAEHLDMLCDSMLGQGFLRTKPLVVRLSADQKTATIIDGHCRYAAARMAVAAGAEIKSIPCVSEGKGVSAADRVLMLLTSNNGLSLQPLEQAEAVKRLLSFGWTEADIGRKIGRTRQHIANLLDLAAAPDGVKAMVNSGQVSATAAVQTVRSNGDKAVAVLQAAAAHAAENGKSRVTPAAIRAVRTPLQVVAPKKPVPVVVATPDPVPDSDYKQGLREALAICNEAPTALACVAAAKIQAVIDSLS
jgi:ParB family chromosome partitioning protein